MSLMRSPDPRSAASFRDPSGFLFTRDGILYRQINRCYADNYERLMGSGLYQELIGEGRLIPHEEVGIEAADSEQGYKTIRPETVAFLSYPYEWSFSQLKDAALATLAIQKKALRFELSLKDASAFNIQFYDGRPILIDTLSFEAYREGEPWSAYRQFCQHFLAPLALMTYRDVRLSQLLRVYIDGVPLDLTSRLLPFRTRFSPSLLAHLHLHALAQRRYAGRTVDKEARKGRMGRNAFVGLMDNLVSAVSRLKWQPEGTDWVDYYADTNYTEGARQHKRQLVELFLEQIEPRSVWDLGSNTGEYSRLASDRGISTVAFDMDAGAVERNYLNCRAHGETNILPLVMDLTNPSSGIGWHHQERMSLLERGPADAVLALALIHHLAIGNNVPLDRLAHFLSEACQWLIIEFVPKSDSQVQRLLATREDIFPSYTQTSFEQLFEQRFAIDVVAPIQDSERVLYLMQRRGSR